MTEKLATRILDLAKARGLTVTCAESCTGGKVSAALTDIAGSSAIFERGFITYSNQAKSDMLGVSPSALNAFGAVSEEVAREMAQGALNAAQADVAVAISGIAGPGGSEHKPEGRVCYALATRGALTSQTIEHGALGRGRVRDAATLQALTMIREALED